MVISFRPADGGKPVCQQSGLLSLMQGSAGQAGRIPTAVNLPRTCRTMVTVITRAMMCIALAAPWKMMVLASSMLRA